MSRTGTGIKERYNDSDTRVAKLRNVRDHAIVQVDGRWGVAIAEYQRDAEGHYIPGAKVVEIVDFWDGGREFVAPNTMVEVLKDGKL